MVDAPHLGGIVAGGLFVLPSMVLLIGLSWVYVAYGHVPVVAAVFDGIKPAVTAIVLQAAWRIGSRVLRNPALWGIATLSFVAMFFLKVPFPAIVLTAAIVGVVGSRWRPASFAAGGGGHGSAAAAHGPALIDDDTPRPPHTQFRWSRLAWVGATGAVLWGAPMTALTQTLGWTHTLTQMGWFFTKAALMTFGGAYAVLPYVYQGAVGHYAWLTPTQMMDGLALGETTPGPLIMVVAFVAFVGGVVSPQMQALFGPDGGFLAGAAAATLVTWFTFLPSFLFILAGGPVIESTHHDIKFTAPLTAITAAVVGVVVNLALFFGQHLLWPQGLGGPFNIVAALITVGAAVALLRFKYSVIEVIIGCGVLGLASKALQF